MLLIRITNNNNKKSIPSIVHWNTSEHTHTFVLNATHINVTATKKSA
jgi:hypothetical protein